LQTPGESVPPALQRLAERAIKKIKKHAHAGHRHENVQRFVEEWVTMNDEFALGDPTALFALISEGVHIFSKKT
jgi:hypothetical protein